MGEVRTRGEAVLERERERGPDDRFGGEPTETVRLLASNPDATVVDDGANAWLVSAVPDPGVREAIESGASFDDVRTLLTERGGEYSLVRVSADGDLSIRAHRGITSGYDVFFLRASNGDVVVTDLFRNAIAHLDVWDRTVTREIVADHLLYRSVPRGTYVAEIDRLEHGESLHWRPERTAPDRSLTETLSASRRLDADRAVLALDEALERATDYGDEDDDGLVSMLSGGVDSTLLYTYLPSGTPSVSGAFETPEFDFEVDYAKTASTLLGTDHELLTAPESSFCERLEEAIDAIGMPPQQLQVPTFDMVYRNDAYDTYVNGQTAEGLFGQKSGVARTVWWTRHLRHLPAIHPTQRTHEEFADRLVRSPWDPRSAAQQYSQYPSIDHVTDFVDERLVEKRQHRRLMYVRSRVPLADATDSYAAHMDWGHWLLRLCDNTINAYRQLAQARGKAFRAPFATRAVAETALAVPSPDRYVDGRETKPIPKKLLDQKVPAYETSKPKGNGNLPARRFLTDGPLVAAQERYELPAFTPVSRWDEAIDRYPGLGWILVSWAIWRDRVLRNDDVTVAPETRSLAVSP